MKKVSDDFWICTASLKVLGYAILSCAAANAATTTTEHCKNFTVISHRGLSGLFPEESSIGYTKASDLHTDYLEMDVHRTKDGVLIVNHDDTFARLTDIKDIYPTRINDQIRTFTWDEISKLKNKGAPILRLEDVIKISLTHPNHPGLYIESKSPELYPGYEKQIVDLLAKNDAFKKVKIIFQSFDQESLLKFKALRPEIPRVYLSEVTYPNLLKTDLETASKIGSGIGPNFDEIPNGELENFLAKAHALKLVVHFWTIDDPQKLETIMKAKADGVFTNRTDVAFEVCKKATHH